MATIPGGGGLPYMGLRGRAEIKGILFTLAIRIFPLIIQGFRIFTLIIHDFRIFGVRKKTSLKTS